ncbi:Phosphoenolpyruvate carboxykinase (ATP) [Clarias magur]|uniref:Phosphoenolpyruvate carboxykinase (ATP) n=1 Tax=Clarias magur TaxID=1594786 RepID=A0A8J4TSB3_CLAMG|nr:Phosphoenolpyruvate carboxykinase (ATP) [Clarias magur]
MPVCRTSTSHCCFSPHRGRGQRKTFSSREVGVVRLGQDTEAGAEVLQRHARHSETSRPNSIQAIGISLLAVTPSRMMGPTNKRGSGPIGTGTFQGGCIVNEHCTEVRGLDERCEHYCFLNPEPHNATIPVGGITDETEYFLSVRGSSFHGTIS